jgi:tetratricopeptide (TPR) repeat protein
VATNRDKVLEAAQKFVEKKKYDKAVAELKKIVEIERNDAKTLLRIGDLQQRQGLHADAIGTYESVGKLYASQGFALKAIAVYKQIREIIAKHAPQLEERYAHVAPKLAELYQQLGLTSDALAALDEVATRLQRAQRDVEAIDVFRKIVELDPSNPLPHLRLAEALSRARDVDGAVHEFKTAAAQLASIQRRDDAIKVLERLLHHKPDPEQARLCAELYLTRDQPQDGMQALAKLQICFQANPRDFDTLALLARAFNAIGQGPKAIEVQKEMARVARDTGRLDLFREILERLLRVAPRDEGVLRMARSEAAKAAAVASASSGAAAAMDTSEDLPPSSAALRVPGVPHRHEPSRPAEHVAHGSVAEAADEAEELDEFEAIEDDDAVEAELDEFRDDAQNAEDAAAIEALEDVDDVEDVELSADADEPAGTSTHGESHAPLQSSAPPLDAADIAVAVAKALDEANTFRSVRLYGKAIEVLRTALDVDPRSMDVRELYRDVLIESDQIEQAVLEMLEISSMYITAFDSESAARALQDVLAFDPTNARAIAMLQELGYEIVEEGDPDAEAPSSLAADAALSVGDAATPDVTPPEPSSPNLAADRTSEQLEVASDEEPPPIHYDEDILGDGALPSYPLEDDLLNESGVALEARDETRDGSAKVPHAMPNAGAPASAAASPSTTHELEDALDEAEFFCSRGLLDDARTILLEQLARFPKHPLVQERLEELDGLEAERASGTRERPNGTRDEHAPSLELGSSLDALESLDYQALEPAEGHSHGSEQVDVEEVFAKFKEGVAKQISVDDSESHYNLGIAYKEMQLLDDAVREFDVAARDPKYECVCRSMIGMIEIERGNINQAIDAFLAGLQASAKEPSQETALCFELGAAYEARKMLKEALSYYQKAMRRDPNYRDVQERVRRLSKAESKSSVRQIAVGSDDEFDRAFDDLLSKP